MCIFYNKKYIELLKILLLSLKKFGKIDETIDILILTHESFKTDLENFGKENDISFKTVILDSTTIEETKWARFEIFNLDRYIKINEYSKILYLDTDVIIQKYIKDVFKLELQDKLYGKDAGNISGEYYGQKLFQEWFDLGNGRDIDKKTKTFCSGVLLFKPSERIKELFNATLMHIKEYKNSGKKFGTCIDQPFINFNTIIRNMQDIELLKNIVTNNPDINTIKETICHFAGDTCNYDVKIIRMSKLYDNLIKNN